MNATTIILTRVQESIPSDMVVWYASTAQLEDMTGFGRRQIGSMLGTHRELPDGTKVQSARKGVWSFHR